MSALQGASSYLNNLLLARGLLANGKTIEFAHPLLDGDDAKATMSKVINLVHELVLRRDRELEQHEHMASMIRTFRVEESQRLLDFQRVQDKNVQLQSDLNTSQAQRRSLQSTMKRTEMQVREAKEQNLKLKSMLDQVRAKCISDIRKKDQEIEKLKSHISGLQRGRKETCGMRVNTLNTQSSIQGARERRGTQVASCSVLTLEKETNDFLAALVNETSSENFALRQIVNGAIETIRDLTGMEILPAQTNDEIGIPGQYRKSRQTEDALVSCQILSEQMRTVLEHCRVILKDPSFVPIEEVHIREEEIVKLRAGWEKMADRWKQAVTMMAQWKQRMLDEGKSMDMGEFKDLSFGRSIAVRPDGQPVLGQDDDLSSIYDQSAVCVESDDHSDNIEVPSLGSDEESELELELGPVPKRLASSPAKRGIRIQRPAVPLQESDGNISRTKSKQSHQKHQSPNGRDLADFENTQSDGFEPEVPKLTVSEKLAVVQAEAIEAEKARQSKAIRKRKLSAQHVRTRKPSRRRSTLSPDELAALMGTR